MLSWVQHITQRAKSLRSILPPLIENLIIWYSIYNFHLCPLHSNQSNLSSPLVYRSLRHRLGLLHHMICSLMFQAYSILLGLSFDMAFVSDLGHAE